MGIKVAGLLLNRAMMALFASFQETDLLNHLMNAFSESVHSVGHSLNISPFTVHIDISNDRMNSKKKLAFKHTSTRKVKLSYACV